MVGRILSNDLFDPKAAIIIQNKDDLNIPLMMEAIPTPKEFQDAIESLSPEQQAFAKAFRAMQLESTLFGVCIIQIKPQLEKLLNLPDDSLTKEIELTQDLLNMFIQYQIPSDLLSYAGDPDANVAQKLNVVKGHVAAMQEMIAKSKQRQLEEQQQVREYSKAQSLADEIVCFEAKKTKVKRSIKRKKSVVKKECKSSGPVSKMKMKSSSAVPDSAPAPTPAPQQDVPPPEAPSQPDQQEPEQKQPSLDFDTDGEGIDITSIPSELDSKYGTLDEDAAVRATIIHVGQSWTKKYQKGLLSPPSTDVLEKQNQEHERNRAFDLLDALSRSGVLSVDQASLHVVVAATHCFDKTLMNAVIQDNVNPIEKVERSILIAASTIHRIPTENLLKPEHAERIKAHSPQLFTDA